jgi:glycosyltransferase involved in cell wall biosynthesis
LELETWAEWSRITARPGGAPHSGAVTLSLRELVEAFDRKTVVRIALLALHFAEYSARLALALADRHDILLVLNSRNARDELTDGLRAQIERSVTVRCVELLRLRDPRIAMSNVALVRMLRDFSPDVLHMQEVHPAHAGWALLCFRKQIPVIMTVHDPWPHSGGLSRDHWIWKTVLWFRRRASRYIVHGPQVQAEVHEVDPRMAGRTDIIPHGTLGHDGVDEDVSGCEPATFLFFGRVQPYKGLSYLLDACDMLRRRGRTFRLVIAGTGPDLARHRDRIAAAGSIELIDRYIGVEEVPGLFRRALGVVLPYTDASQSGVSAMAFALARPVIATRVGDVPDVVVDGQTGLLVPPRDGAALADAMERMLLERGLRDTLAAGAARFAKEKLAWPRIAELTCDTYLRALAAHATRGVGRPLHEPR